MHSPSYSIRPLKSVFAILCIALLSALVESRSVHGQAGDRGAGSGPDIIIDTKGVGVGPSADIAFSPDGRLLAAVSMAEVRIWDLKTGELARTLYGDFGEIAGEYEAIAFSPDGRQLLVGTDLKNGNFAIRVYATDTFSQRFQMIDGKSGPIQNFAFSHDGTYLAAAMFVEDHFRIVIWNWKSRRVVASLTDRKMGWYQYFGFPDTSSALLVLGTESFGVWQAPRWKPMTPEQTSGALHAFLARITSALWPMLPKGQWTGVVPWDIRLGRSGKDEGLALVSAISDRDGVPGYRAFIYRLDQRSPTRVYRKNRYDVLAAALSKDCELAATLDRLGEIHVWEVLTGRQRFCFRGVTEAVYSVGFDSTGQRLAIGTTPFGPEAWRLNHYAKLKRAFNLSTRTLTDDVSDCRDWSALERNELQLALAFEEDSESRVYQVLRCLRNGSRWSHFSNWVGECHWASFLQNARFGVRNPLAVGARFALLPPGILLLDPKPDSNGRMKELCYLPTLGVPWCFSESPRQDFVAVGTEAGVVLLYDLTRFEAAWDFDFQYSLSASAPKVAAVSAAIASRDRIRPGDVLLSMAGVPIEKLFGDPETRMKFRPGQRVSLELKRDGNTLRTETILREDLPVCTPILILLVTESSDWVLWSEKGYYDCSPSGDRFIGWLVDEGPLKESKYFPADRFRGQMYRPDIIDRIVATGDVKRAIAEANAALPRPRPAIDLRNRQQFHELQPPEVRILSPVEGLTTYESTVTLRGEVRYRCGMDMPSVFVLVNGRRAPDAKGVLRERSQAFSPVSDKLTRVEVERVVQLVPGRNVITLLAGTNKSISNPVAVNVHRKSSLEIKPDLYLLAVGVSTYADPKISDLKFADRDAIAFADAWKRQQGRFYKKVHSRVLVEEDATAQTVRDGMDWLDHSVTQHDVAILFFSGHGVLDHRQSYHLVTQETQLSRLRSTTIAFSEVNQLIANLPCKVILFVDTCHSAGITGAKSLVRDPWRDLVSEEIGGVVFASSTAREVSVELDELQHGAFTYAILNVLTDPKYDTLHDGLLEINELDLHITSIVKQVTSGKQHPATQKPATIRSYPVASVLPK